jgi:hypothetical protein
MAAFRRDPFLLMPPVLSDPAVGAAIGRDLVLTVMTRSSSSSKSASASSSSSSPELTSLYDTLGAPRVLELREPRCCLATVALGGK